MANSDGGFGLYIHHGGKFMTVEQVKHYIGGCLVSRLDWEVDRFGYLDLEDEVEKLGYVRWDHILYRFPGSNEKFVELHNDKDVMNMLALVSDNCRVFHIFVDGGVHLGHNTDDEEEIDDKQKGVPSTGSSLFQPGFEGDDEHEVGDGDDEHELEHVHVQTDKVGSNSSEDEDYVPSELEDYSDDEMADDELLSDEEYIAARKCLRDKSEKGLCDEVFSRENADAEGGFLEYDISDGDIYSSEIDKECDRRKKMIRNVTYDPMIDPKDLKLSVGMRFEDGFQARDAIKENAVEEGRGIHFRRVSTTQMEAYYNPPCKWRCYGSLLKRKGYFMIKEINQPHTCTTAIRNNQVTSSWIPKRYLNVFRYRPELTVKELKGDILRRFNCEVLRWKLYKAKDKAVEMLRGTVEEHYAKLRSYILELRRQDLEGRFELWCDVGAVFRGLYVGFSGLRRGFQAGCRRIIGIDGAFLKTYLGGVLLCAVGNDGSNQMFPIAWAVVEIENLENWSWFLKILIQDLGLGSGAGTTFISDQQKGLIRAISEEAPQAEHRNCASHVFMNWKKSHGGLILKNMFWRCVRSTYMDEFNEALDAMKAKSVAAYEDFVGRDITKFCKVFLNPSTVSDMILNNTTESFNGYIINARGKHVIHMLEEIRTSLMVRQHTKSLELNDYEHNICPEILKKVEQMKYYSRHCVPHAASNVLFEVEKYGDRFIVDVRARTCTCRRWDITGIPCIYACAAIHLLREEAANYCNEAYSVAKYRETYRHGLPPLNGEKMWPRAEGYPVVPPAAKKMPWRPKKKRKRDAY